MIDLPPEAKALLEQARRDHNPTSREALRVRRALYTKLGIAGTLLPASLPAPAAAAKAAATKVAVVNAAAVTPAATAPVMATSAAAATGAAVAATKVAVTKAGVMATLWSLKATKIALAVVTISGVASLPLVMRDAPTDAAGGGQAASSAVQVAPAASGRVARSPRPSERGAPLEPTVEQLAPTVEQLAPATEVTPPSSVTTSPRRERSPAPVVSSLASSQHQPARMVDGASLPQSAPEVRTETTAGAPTGANAVLAAAKPVPAPRAIATPTTQSATRRDAREAHEDDPLADVLPSAMLRDRTVRDEPIATPPAARVTAVASSPIPLLPAPTASEPERREELALIRGALLSLRDGSPMRALSLLGEHAIQYPRGVFASERRGLRVIALCTAGRLDEGREQRKVFLREEGASPMAERVRNSCQEVSHP